MSPAVTRRLIAEFAARPENRHDRHDRPGRADRPRARGRRPRRRRAQQRRDRHRAVHQPGDRPHPRQPGDDQAQRPRSGPARRPRLRVRPHQGPRLGLNERLPYARGRRRRSRRSADDIPASVLHRGGHDEHRPHRRRLDRCRVRRRRPRRGRHQGLRARRPGRHRPRRRRRRDPPRPVHRGHGPVGVGQVDAHALPRRPRLVDVGRGVARRHRARLARRPLAHGLAARAGRVRLPGLQPAADAHGAREHHPAVRARRPPAGPRVGRPASSTRSGSVPACATGRRSSPAASSSASPSPAPWPPGPSWCSPTSRRATSTRPPAPRSSSSSAPRCGRCTRPS